MKPLFQISPLSSIGQHTIQPYSLLIEIENKGIRRWGFLSLFLLRYLIGNKVFKAIQSISPKVRRTYTWITLCKRSATQGNAIPSLIPNSVGVQPATGLVSLPSFTPRYATLTRGYQYQTPSELKGIRDNSCNSRTKKNK